VGEKKGPLKSVKLGTTPRKIVKFIPQIRGKKTLLHGSAGQRKDQGLEAWYYGNGKQRL